ncbi:MAG: hypothetical protein ACE5IW_09770 [bacterium]
MFRINKIFENDLTVILKIEGELSDKNLQDWSDEINRLIKLFEQKIIVELCKVTSMCPKAVQVLIDLITENIYLLNCPTLAKNMLHAAGLSANILE